MSIKFFRIREGSATKSDEFMLQILGTLTGLFEHEIDTKRVNSGFRVCLFNNCIEKNQNKTHFEEGMCMHFILSGPHTF